MFSDFSCIKLFLTSLKLKCAIVSLHLQFLSQQIMKKIEKTKPKKSRLQLVHQYYSYTGFYSFIGKAILKALPVIALVVLAIVLVNTYFDLNTLLVNLTETLPKSGVLAFFFASEILLGLIPPEIFIAWAGKLDQQWLFLAALAVLSYVGGLITYWIGNAITSLPKVHNYLAVKMKKQLKNSRKWGGFLIMVGAILPLPFSMACLGAGIIEFPFKKVVVYGSLRLVRYAIYGLLIFGIV